MRSADMMCEFVTLADFSPQKKQPKGETKEDTKRISVLFSHLSCSE